MEESQGSEYSSVSGSISIDFWQFFMQASKIFLSSRIGVQVKELHQKNTPMILLRLLILRVVWAQM